MAMLAAPLFAVAQQPTAQPAATQSALHKPVNGENAPDITPKQEKNELVEFMHAPMVGRVGKMLHLSLNTASLLFAAINFAIILIAVVIPITRILPKVIRKRSQTIAQDLKTARAATADAKMRLSAVEAKLAGLDHEIQQMRAQIEQESREDEARIKAAIEEERARIVASAEQEISVVAAQARRSLRHFAADLAIEHAEKQITLTPETDRALISEFIGAVSADSAAKGGQN